MQAFAVFTKNLESFATGLNAGYRIGLNQDGFFQSVRVSFFGKRSYLIQNQSTQATLVKVKEYLKNNQDNLLNQKKLTESLNLSLEKRIKSLNIRLYGFFSFFLFNSTRKKIEDSIAALTDIKALTEHALKPTSRIVLTTPSKSITSVYSSFQIYSVTHDIEFETECKTPSSPSLKNYKHVKYSPKTPSKSLSRCGSLFPPQTVESY